MFSMEMFYIGSQQMDLAVSLSILLKSSAESFDHLIIEQLPNLKFTVSMRITMMVMIIMIMIIMVMIIMMIMMTHQ